MALTPRLEMKQGQSLVMTPQLQQAIKLLQLSNLELSAYVEQELERNPFLERNEGERGEAERGEGEPAGEGDGAKAADDRRDLTETSESLPSDGTLGLDADYESLYADASKTDITNDIATARGTEIDWSKSGSGGGSRFEDGEGDLEGTLSDMPSLRDALTEQLHIAIPDPTRRMVGSFLIDLVDEAGYLRGELDDVAARLGAPIGLVEETLRILQGFEPAGVFARHLGECLGLQLAERDRLDPAMAKLLEHLDMLACHDIERLMALCGVDAEDMKEMIAEIRALNPKPGLAYGHDVVQPVVPDVYVRENPQDGWQVELNVETLPKVLVNAVYYAEVSSALPQSEDKTYITECLNNANWLVKSLDQRAKTILKVASEIVRQQDGFLAHGIRYLRPLNLRTVADAISMHESTVSRVTANKFIATPRGLFEFKYFFTSAIASSGGGEAHSAEAVRHRIKELIDGEGPASVLSDDRIVELLKGAGIDIARRTVAKYREAMSIPSSVQRRRLKKAMAV